MESAIKTYGDFLGTAPRIVSETFLRPGCWYIPTVTVWEENGHFFRATLSRPATECQEWPDATEPLQVTEVEPTVMTYKGYAPLAGPVGEAIK